MNPGPKVINVGFVGKTGGSMGRAPCMKSRVHPKYKTKYRVNNWAEYDRALVQRGDITLWIAEDAIASWKPGPTGLRGAQRKFSDHAIETALTLRLIFRLPLRQAEGFLRSVLSLMGVATKQSFESASSAKLTRDLEAPDHTTLSRRSQHLDVDFHLAPAKPLHLIVDSTGLSIVGEGEWAAAMYGGRGRRGWKKLHLGVDRAGMIVVRAPTDGNTDDAKAAQGFIDEVHGDIASFTADAAHDTNATYNAAAARGARIVVPPIKTATRSRQRRARSSTRDRTIMRVKEIGRRRWKKESGYHRRAVWRTPSFDTRQSLAPDFVLVIRGRRKLKR